ncbi:hypothetical protein ACLOJK_008492 [Asimina triloba]
MSPLVAGDSNLVAEEEQRESDLAGKLQQGACWHGTPISSSGKSNERLGCWQRTPISSIGSLQAGDSDLAGELQQGAYRQGTMIVAREE